MPFLYEIFASSSLTPVPSEVTSAVCKQANAELYAQYLYNAMGFCLQTQGLPGMALWMFKQAHEEEEHAFKLVEFLTLKGQRVKLTAVNEPEAQWWDKPIDAFHAALEHEKKVTAMIHELEAKIMPFHSSHPELGIKELVDWFLHEQEEEEESVGNLIEKLETLQKEKRLMQDIDFKIGQMRKDE
ncbi:putative ferritin heavy chain [Monocercomonoides exilis]|uniref:putative ferritin heavy chain n=1 Tax=Monocercomonoides exilis TaxID=2049356 RepID=UPI00355A2F2C|nr:putative ferritin heavy chain [Monocercomonoides exilis]|eukprot:MONOS_1659.1-p1 / transcript=MONOS_1659.1 / gene=MONOS_1659 / organism=Monocercomonoides_exilis_PA203 / gene_product=Ferroxidase / transcript_product=Ferroxidase / location=Mono_scaffold00030:167475-168290(-) / protein_length=185 / sequence_SO=supercontig / SO=protein_coding / is_pseudo=false